MNNNRKRVTLLNTVSSLFLQLITIIGGFIIPRIILKTFGSDTNGLVSSLNQFLNFAVLLEGGLNSVIMASLYKPIAKKDTKKISSIIVTSKKFFSKISLLLIIYGLIVATAYPLCTNNDFSYEFIFSLAMILTIKLFTQYCFTFSYQNLLRAGKHGYIPNLTHAILIIGDIALAFIISRYFPSIHLLKLFSAILYLLQPIVYIKYSNKIYKLDNNAREDKTLIKNRWDGLSINLAAFIHNNTDIVVLTLFTNLKTVSIYGVYNIIIVGLRGIIQSINTGIAPSIGNLYASEDKKVLMKRFNEFEYINFMMTFFSFSMALLLATPFVMIYTTGITDADYYQPIFCYIILMAEFVYLLREPYVKTAYMAGKFKEQKKHAYAESAINIIISLILVYKLGLIGIAIGTFIAMAYRTAFQILFLRNNVLHRPFTIFLKKFCAFLIPTTIALLLCFRYIPLTDYSIRSWILHAIIYALIFGILLLIISILFFKKELTGIIRYLQKKDR